MTEPEEFQLSYHARDMKDSLLTKRGRLFRVCLLHWVFELSAGRMVKPVHKLSIGDHYIMSDVFDYSEPVGKTALDANGFSWSNLSESLALEVLVGSRLCYMRLGLSHNYVKDPYSIAEGPIRISQEVVYDNDI